MMSNTDLDELVVELDAEDIHISASTLRILETKFFLRALEKQLKPLLLADAMKIVEKMIANEL